MQHFQSKSLKSYQEMVMEKDEKIMPWWSIKFNVKYWNVSYLLKYIIPIHFDNIGPEFIHFHSKQKRYHILLARKLRETEIVSTVYSLSNTITNNVLNHKNTVKNISTNDTRSYGTGIVLCNCTISKYLNHHHGHILPRDLQIIKIKKFGKILSKGPSCRELKTINWEKSKETIAEETI